MSWSNNAGFSWIGPTAELDVATFDRLFTANVPAPYFLVAALAPTMAARGGGSIINVGSQSGQIGDPPGARRPARRDRQRRRAKAATPVRRACRPPRNAPAE